VIADGNHIEFFGYRFFNERSGIHIQVTAGRKAGMDVKITAKRPEHDNYPEKLKKRP
jgi:hypothetical protein